jgi:hypothetical protein
MVGTKPGSRAGELKMDFGLNRFDAADAIGIES